MLINKDASNINHVKFISYTGSYPNLCRGILTLEIDGKRYRFGHNYMKDYHNDGNYNSFWSSGGSCGFTDNWSNSYVDHGEWIIDVNDLPEEIKKYAAEIDEVFNNNVNWGCCGGCL